MFSGYLLHIIYIHNNFVVAADIRLVIVLQVLGSQVAAAKKTQLLVETICSTLSKGQ